MIRFKQESASKFTSSDLRSEINEMKNQISKLEHLMKDVKMEVSILKTTSLENNNPTSKIKIESEESISEEEEKIQSEEEKVNAINKVQLQKWHCIVNNIFKLKSLVLINSGAYQNSIR